MSKALNILEANELMRHLILFKLYIESEGRAMKRVDDIKKPIMELYGSDFNNELFRDSIRYLFINKKFVDRYANELTYEGVDYFESWLKSFENVTKEETDELKRELPQPIFDFFNFTKNSTTLLSFLNQILKLSDKF
ncbi:hypothetical protein [Winogradskyella sediminis]|uniref:hypothetical protein n=1 Tax=Winogradskyella sediminis TaxID=1382466 RepID=UPI000E269C2A|nr:hypothetical protein [Winogradskyella sediminis]REG89150.1 hypothetical protein C8N41_101388 [Winogradskyella sediminis]